ncbi:hypothetical protein B484DRAFT_454702 [Ochromonadaceae sp. CCMP2298]|nr:hypothetical protein B484DRAFT_454702 [Ochromonadaceae sp. CCMP2298]
MGAPASLLILFVLAYVGQGGAFHARGLPLRTPRVCPRPVVRSTQLQAAWQDIATSQLVAVGDYAAEIEGSVGSEIYGPIFKAGLFIFASGLVSSFVAAFIVSSSDSWDDLELEFQAGKEAQFIDNTASEEELAAAIARSNSDVAIDRVASEDDDEDVSDSSLQDLDI